MSKGYGEDEWKKYWADDEAEVYQFIGEDNLYFYGPAQQAIWHAMGQNLKPTNIIPSKHVLFLNKKASSSGSFKPPMATDLLNHYTAEQMRLHFLGMNLGNNNVSFMPKAFNPDANPDEVDVVLKEGNLLTNVYNRVLRTLFYTVQEKFDGIVPVGEISEQVKQESKNAILNYERFMYEHKFHQAVNTVDVYVRNINKYWVKEIKEPNVNVNNLIANTMEQIRVANILLHPMAPHGTNNVANYLGFKEDWSNWDNIFENVYTLFENPNNHKLKELKQKEDFFKKHPTQLDFE
jgi:methionyl-tRNA synthetase